MLELQDALRRCELKDIIINYIKSEDFEMFIRIFSVIECKDKILLHNLKFMYECVETSDYKGANLYLNYFYNRKSIFFEDRFTQKI